ncbi:MAG: hypothetical protein MZV63_32950 [Marinilabiliales bacterium]|nr:hypothetical protein [Marinilabiliales bacterium]
MTCCAIAARDTAYPFRVIMEKEMADHIRSWEVRYPCRHYRPHHASGRCIRLLTSFSQACRARRSGGTVFFLRLFTLSDGTVPSFAVLHKCPRAAAGHRARI